MLKIHVLFCNVIQICYICTDILQFYPSIKTIKIMSTRDIIDLTRNNYWGKEDFLEDIERVRKLLTRERSGAPFSIGGKICPISTSSRTSWSPDRTKVLRRMTQRPRSGESTATRPGCISPEVLTRLRSS